MISPQIRRRPRGDDAGSPIVGAMNSAPRPLRTPLRRLLLAVVLAVLAAAVVWAGVAPPPARAAGDGSGPPTGGDESPVAARSIQSTGHGRGHLWSGDGVSWLGTYRLADGRFAFCLEVGKSSPVGHDYDIAEGTGGLALSAADRARLAFIARTWSGTTNADTAAAAQLAVWSITGLGGHTLDYYAGRANDHREAVLAKANAFIARASTEATTGATALVKLRLAADGTGTVAAGVKQTRVGGGSVSVPAGTHTGVITLTGAKFGTGQATKKSVENGRVEPIRATGFGPTNRVTAAVDFGALPYRSTLTVGSSSADAQKLLFTTSATGSAKASASATAVSPRPFSPKVVTHTSETRAEKGAAITDTLTLSVAPVVDQLTEWGVYETTSGARNPIPVTVRSTLFGPFADQPTRSATWPTGAPQVCTVATLAAKGPGDYRTKSCTLPSDGYYVWAESISPKDTAVSQGRSRIRAWTSAFGTAAETTLVPHGPTITTAVDTDDVAPGGCVVDHLDAAGFPAEGVEVESFLVGPLSERPAEGDELADLDSLPVAGRATTVVSGDGRFDTPCVQVSEPGYYVFVYRSDGAPELPAFADLTVHREESFRVRPQPEPTPTPTPTVTPRPPCRPSRRRRAPRARPQRRRRRAPRHRRGRRCSRSRARTGSSEPC